MQRREFLRTTGVAASCGALAGCAGQRNPTGLLVARVRDRDEDLEDFESCVVTIRELRVLSAEAATETEDHRGAELLFSVRDAAVDLVEIAEGETAFAFEQELVTGAYAYLKLAVASVEATLTGGREALVETPDDGPVKVARSFDVRADQATVVTAGLSPVQRGAATSFVLRPAPSLTTVEYE
jgi:hypothetical protein